MCQVLDQDSINFVTNYWTSVTIFKTSYELMSA